MRGRRGVMFYACGEVYVGYWKPGRSPDGARSESTPTGKNKIASSTPDGQVYLELSDSSSEGSSRSSSPAVPDRPCLRHGQGKSGPRQQCGSICREGWGVHLQSRGRRYEGQWHDDLQHGFGFMHSVVAEQAGRPVEQQELGRVDGLAVASHMSNDDSTDALPAAAIVEPASREEHYLGAFVAGTQAGRGMLVSRHGLLREEIRSSTGQLLHSWPLFEGRPDGSASDARCSTVRHEVEGRSSSEGTQQEPQRRRSFEQGMTSKQESHCARYMSNLQAVESWSPLEVSYLASCIGLGSRVAARLKAHRIDGAALLSLTSPSASSFVAELFEGTDAGSDHGQNPKKRLFLLAVRLFLRVRHKLSTLHFSRSQMRLQFQRLEIDKNDLIFDECIGEGGCGTVYKAKWQEMEVAAKASYARGPRAARHEKQSVAAESECGLPRKEGKDTTAATACETSNPTMADSARKRDTSQAEPAPLENVPQDFFSELAVLRRLRHPNILQVFGFCLQPQPILITELVKGCSLYDLLHRRLGRRAFGSSSNWFFSDVVGVAREVCFGMTYMHAKQILHCDLKSQNILLSSSSVAPSSGSCLSSCFQGALFALSSSHCHGCSPGAAASTNSVKICDFGFAVELLRTSAHTRSVGANDADATSLQVVHVGCRGTFQWMAPEVLRGEGCSKASDVYSFGMVLWEMIYRKVPFEDFTALQVAGLVGYARRTAWLPESCPDLLQLPLRKLLRQRQHAREGFAEVSKTLGAMHHSAITEAEQSLRLFLSGE